MRGSAFLVAVLLPLIATGQESVADLERAAAAHAKAGEFDKAEALLARALAGDPGNFKVLYNLGVAASFAGHHERAREVLETALRQQPQNVNALYSLAYVNLALKRKDAALRLVAQAAQLSPQRSDIQKLLAIVTGDLEAYADSLAAWDRYLKLEPNDDFARRERGFAAVRTGQFEPGIAELEWFLKRHPDDPVGHYELGLAESQRDPARALAHLDRALALKPGFAEARAARGGMHYRQGKPETAVADLEAAAAHRPNDAFTLDRLGQTYLALDRAADAVRVLRRAAALAPEDSTIQLHFGRALAEAGQTAESQVAMDRFRQLGPSKKRAVPAGLLEYLSLAPDRQRADYRARVEKAVGGNPRDAATQARYLQLLLEDGKLDEAAATARRIAGLKPGAAALAGAGRALLASRQYPLAKELLEQAAGESPSPEVALDLAIATFHATGAGPALQLMDRVPESGRSVDYYLARAHMLAAAGRTEDLASVLELLDKAERALPGSREVLLAKATTLELAGRSGAAEPLLKQILNRWPEWHAGWVAQGIVLGNRGRFEEARRALETAVALGARSPEVHYCLAGFTLRSAPNMLDAAEAAAQQALKLAPADPWIHSLAGRIASARGEDATAAERLREAVRLNPRVSVEKPPHASRLFRERPPRDW